MKKIFVFGEVLFDAYKNRYVIGGAPFNFSAHLSLLGCDASLISAVGKDSLGTTARNAVKSFGIADFLLNETDYPTGICEVNLTSEGKPEYNLRENQAYDNIRLTENQMSAISREKNKCLYFGTLAQRNSVSELTLKHIIKSCVFDDIFFDINIRQQYYSDEILEFGLRTASIIKFSREEADVFSFTGFDCGDKKTLCGSLAKKYKNIKLILVTLDSDGAMVYEAESKNYFYCKAAPAQPVSGVGAGDSFFAAYVHAMLAGIPAQKALEQSVLLSAYVVSHLDAVPEYDSEIKAALSIE